MLRRRRRGAAARAQGVCHRDLKLENTLLDGRQAPRLKICDFGYSKSAVFDSQPKSTVGTPAYIAPEARRPSLPLTPMPCRPLGAYEGAAPLRRQVAASAHLHTPHVLAVCPVRACVPSSSRAATGTAMRAHRKGAGA